MRPIAHARAVGREAARQAARLRREWQAAVPTRVAAKATACMSTATATASRWPSQRYRSTPIRNCSAPVPTASWTSAKTSPPRTSSRRCGKGTTRSSWPSAKPPPRWGRPRARSNWSTRSRPGEWFVLAPPGAAVQVAGWLTKMAADSAGEEFVSVVDLTHGRALVRITGRDAAELMAGCAGSTCTTTWPPTGRPWGLSRHRGRLRRGHGRGTILQHQVPDLRTAPQRRGHRRHRPRAQGALRQVQDRRRPPAAGRPAPREPRRRGPGRGEPAQADREHPPARHPPGSGDQQLPHRPRQRAPGDQGHRR